jgi:hypothetical protein
MLFACFRSFRGSQPLLGTIFSQLRTGFLCQTLVCAILLKHINEHERLKSGLLPFFIFSRYSAYREKSAMRDIRPAISMIQRRRKYPYTAKMAILPHYVEYPFKELEGQVESEKICF